jgi:hypothetical protein
MVCKDKTLIINNTTMGSDNERWRQAAGEVTDAEIIPLFKAITSFADLEKAIDDASHLKTSDGRPYRLEDLQTGLDVARSSRFTNLRGITSSEGLRETVACLLISEVNSLTELSNLLTHISAITGSRDTFSQNVLIDQIQRVINGQAEIETITQTYKLRDTVKRLTQ